MTDSTNTAFADSGHVARYLEHGPPAFTPGHAGLLQMIGVLLAETMPEDGTMLVVGAGGGLETRYLADVEPRWRFVGVDPAGAMLDLARAVAGAVAGERMTLIEGTVADAPDGPFDAATCILVLGLLPDNGGKLDLLRETRARLRPGAAFVLVDQCLDRNAPDFARRLARYAAYARRSGVNEATVARASDIISMSETMVSAGRDEQLLSEAGFSSVDMFYRGMEWRGWIGYA